MLPQRWSAERRAGLVSGCVVRPIREAQSLQENRHDRERESLTAFRPPGTHRLDSGHPYPLSRLRPRRAGRRLGVAGRPYPGTDSVPSTAFEVPRRVTITPDRVTPVSATPTRLVDCAQEHTQVMPPLTLRSGDQNEHTEKLAAQHPVWPGLPEVAPLARQRLPGPADHRGPRSAISSRGTSGQSGRRSCSRP